MIGFRELDDQEPALHYSPLVRATERTFSYITEHGGIGLTPSKAFKRNFVHWAAANFDWPGYSWNELFMVSKVLNEPDFMPLMCLHDMMIALKIGRHIKGTFGMTKEGQSLIGHPGKIFDIMAPFLLFRVNHEYFSRKPMQLIGNWDVFLNVLNVEAEDGITAAVLRKTLYGSHDKANGYDGMVGGLYVQILRPLCWAGLLVEHKPPETHSLSDRTFHKTPLWNLVLRLETDSQVQPATRH